MVGDGLDEAVKRMLQEQEIGFNSSDCNGRTPLRWAVGNEHKALVKWLVQKTRTDANL